MKVLQIINNLETGGAEKLLLETIPLFNQKGVSMDLLLLTEEDTSFLQVLNKMNCCNIYSLGFRSLYNPLIVFKIIPYLRRFDLIHVHLFPSQYWVIFAKIISLSNVKLIFTEHSTSNRRMQSKVFKLFERFVYSHYSKIICITKEVKEALEIHIGLSDRYIVIENGVDLKKIYIAKKLIKDQINSNIKKNDKLLIQVSAFRKEKDQKTLIKAMQYLPEDVKLILVGDGLLRKKNEIVVEKLKMRERVFFTGVRTDVPQLLKTSDISILSSHWEGFGLVAVEGMAAGKPVIASNVPGLSNIVSGAGVLFKKGDEIELAQKIKELLDDNDHYNRTVETGYERAKQYDINILIERQIKLYKELIE